VDALSHRPYPALSYLLALPNELYEEFRKLELNVITPRAKPMLCALEAQPTPIEDTRVAQAMDRQLKRIKELLVVKASRFVIHENGTIRFRNRECVPVVDALQKKILYKSHNTPYSVHPGENKLCKDKKQTFWWST